METTILQVPIKKEIRDKALIEARKMGFDSLQSFVRYILKLLVERKIEIKVFVKN